MRVRNTGASAPAEIVRKRAEVDGHRSCGHKGPHIKILGKKEGRVSGLGAFPTRVTERHRAEEKTVE